MIDRSKNTTIIVNKEDVNCPHNANLWNEFLDLLHVDGDATEVALSTKPNGLPIVLDKGDINTPLHPHIWPSWMETLKVSPDTDSVTLYLSLLDDNKKI